MQLLVGASAPLPPGAGRERRLQVDGHGHGHRQREGKDNAQTKHNHINVLANTLALLNGWTGKRRCSLSTDSEQKPYISGIPDDLLSAFERFLF